MTKWGSSGGERERVRVRKEKRNKTSERKSGLTVLMLLLSLGLIIWSWLRRHFFLSLIFCGSPPGIHLLLAISSDLNLIVFLRSTLNSGRYFHFSSCYSRLISLSLFILVRFWSSIDLIWYLFFKNIVGLFVCFYCFRFISWRFRTPCCFYLIAFLLKDVFGTLSVLISAPVVLLSWIEFDSCFVFPDI